MTTESNQLIGKIITAVYLAEDKRAIRFDVDGEPLIVRCDADCCSDTWVENFENPEVLIGSPVIEAVDIDMPEAEHPEDKDREVVQYYSFRIRTAKGDCVLDYRNESNGYYGGNLSWPSNSDSYFYGGVHGQNVSEQKWVKLA